MGTSECGGVNRDKSQAAKSLEWTGTGVDCRSWRATGGACTTGTAISISVANFEFEVTTAGLAACTSGEAGTALAAVSAIFRPITFLWSRSLTAGIHSLAAEGTLNVYATQFVRNGAVYISTGDNTGFPWFLIGVCIHRGRRLRVRAGSRRCVRTITVYVTCVGG